MNTPETKVCTSSECHAHGAPQPLGQFRIRTGRTHLRESWCRACNNRRARERWHGVKLRTGMSNSTQQRRLRPYQFVTTELQRASSAFSRGSIHHMLGHLTAATSALERLTSTITRRDHVS